MATNTVFLSILLMTGFLSDQARGSISLLSGCKDDDGNDHSIGDVFMYKCNTCTCNGEQPTGRTAYCYSPLRPTDWHPDCKRIWDGEKCKYLLVLKADESQSCPDDPSGVIG